MAVARLTWPAAGCLLGVLCVTSAADNRAAVPAEYKVLLTAARQALAGRAVALVEGATPSANAPLAAGNVVRSPRNALAEAAALRGLAARRDHLHGDGEAYLAAETDVRFLAATRAGDRLELTVAERTTLFRKRIHGDEPEYTAYQASRTFDFARDGGRWVLTDQRLTGDGPVPVTEPDAIDPSNLPLTSSGGMTEFD
ncbi:MAG TPA: hypothetical protein VGJ95_24985 [Pseudonocardiaceae bacterium]